MKSVKEFPYFSRCGPPLVLPLWLPVVTPVARVSFPVVATPGRASATAPSRGCWSSRYSHNWEAETRATGVTTGSHNGRTRGGPQREKYGKVRNGGNMIGLTWWKQVISVKFTPYQVWRGMCMHPGSRLTTRQFIANSLLLCLFKTLFYSGFTGWGTPFYTQIYRALGGHPSAFHIGKPSL